MPNRFDRKKLLLGFVAVNLFTGVVVGTFQMVIPLFALSINSSNAELGLIRGVTGIGMLLTVIPAGFLVDHFGSKKLYVAGSLCCTIVVLGVGMAATPLALMVLMGLYGFFRSLSLIATNAAFFRHLEIVGMEKAGWVNGSLSLGAMALGPLLGGCLANYLDYSSIFNVVLVLYPVPVLLVVILYRESFRRAIVSDESGKGVSQFQDFKNMIKDSSVCQVMLTEGIGGACTATFGIIMIVIIVKTLKLSSTVASAVLTLQGCAAILVVFCAGSLLKRYSSTNLYLAAFAITSLGLLGLSLEADLAVIVVASAVLGVGLGLVQLVNYSRIGGLRGEKGKISGLLTAAGGFGYSMGPLAAGIASSYIGNRLVFAAFLPLFLLLGLMVSLNSAVAEMPEPEPHLSWDAGNGADE